MLWAALSGGLGAALVLAGVPKAKDRARTTRSVRGFELLPSWAAAVVGAVLPWLEIGLGVVLIAGVAHLVAGVVAAALFAVFFLALAVNLVRGRRDLDCGCFAFGAGADEVAHISWWHAARAASFALGAVLGAVAAPVSPLEHAAGAGIGIFAVAVVGVGLYARSVMSPGRRPIDDYLSAAAIELRAVSSVSRY